MTLRLFSVWCLMICLVLFVIVYTYESHFLHVKYLQILPQQRTREIGSISQLYLFNWSNNAHIKHFFPQNSRCKQIFLFPLRFFFKKAENKYMMIALQFVFQDKYKLFLFYVNGYNNILPNEKTALAILSICKTVLKRKKTFWTAKSAPLGRIMIRR